MSDELSWLSRRQRDGGLDRIPLPAEVPGLLWLCGKHAIGPDHERTIAEIGGRVTVVCLTERFELEDRYPRYVEWLGAEQGSGAIWWPIQDLHAPPLDRMLSFVDDLVVRLLRAEDLLVHCGAGVGRAGTTAVAILLRLGIGLDEALATVAAHRPNAGPEVGAQRDLVLALGALTVADRGPG